MKKPVFLTDDDQFQLVMDHLDGHSVDAIMYRFALSKQAVYRIIDRMVFRLLRSEKLPKRHAGVTYLKTVPTAIAKQRFKRWRKNQ